MDQDLQGKRLSSCKNSVTTCSSVLATRIIWGSTFQVCWGPRGGPDEGVCGGVGAVSIGEIDAPPIHNTLLGFS